MARALAHRGPDGSTIVSDGPAIIGHQLFDVARNGLTQTADAIISFDGRLDNREALLGSLAESPTIRDDALVLAAYRQWGSECPTHLLGDFAFAIWDKSAELLFCARDQIGVRPFYYHNSGAEFTFASEPQAILARFPGFAEQIDEAWIADYMAGYFPPADACLYPAIRRLPPGHIGIATRSELAITCYYRMGLSKPLPCPDAAAQFSAIFEAAVACRMDSKRRIAALLSGGLDSSSIVSVAAGMRQTRDTDLLTTFSMVFSDTPSDDERPFIESVVALGGIAPNYIESGDVTPFANFHALLAQQAGPFIGQNLATSSRLHRIAAERGFGVLLDGHGGDEVVSHGSEWLLDLAYQGRWIRLWREVRDLCAMENASPYRAFLSLLVTSGPHRGLRYAGVRAWRRWRGKPAAIPLRHQYVSPDLADRVGLDERRPASLPDPGQFGQEERFAHLANVASDTQSYALELLDKAAAAAGIELRFPLLDKRLVEFCLSLPSSEKMRGGYTRSIIRRGLAHRLPELVRKRTDKLDFTPHIVRGLVDKNGALVDEILEDASGTLGRYANLAVLRVAWQRLRSKEIAPSYAFDMQAIWRAVALGIWLRNGQKEQQRGVA